jgi:hypothetical protein
VYSPGPVSMSHLQASTGYLYDVGAIGVNVVQMKARSEKKEGLWGLLAPLAAFEIQIAFETLSRSSLHSYFKELTHTS